MLVVALQLCSEHGVPSPKSWQAPLPLHLPFSLQVEGFFALQSSLGSSSPAGTVVHFPRFVENAQYSQVPAQALLQQKPSAQ